MAIGDLSRNRPLRPLGPRPLPSLGTPASTTENRENNEIGRTSSTTLGNDGPSDFGPGVPPHRALRLRPLQRAAAPSNNNEENDEDISPSGPVSSAAGPQQHAVQEPPPQAPQPTSLTLEEFDAEVQAACPSPRWDNLRETDRGPVASAEEEDPGDAAQETGDDTSAAASAQAEAAVQPEPGAVVPSVASPQVSETAPPTAVTPAGGREIPPPRQAPVARIIRYSELLRRDLAAPRDPATGTWLYVGAVALLLGQPGAGKSLLTANTMVSIASGMPLAGETPSRPRKVAMLNLEDDPGELGRRLAAAADAIGAHRALLDENLLVVDVTPDFRFFERGEGTKMVLTREALALFRRLREQGVEVLSLDPFVEIHGANENDNEVMHSVVAALRDFARSARCAVLIVHHTGKQEAGRATVGSSRGASSVGGAVRSARAVGELDKADMARLGIAPGEDRDHFKVDDVKNSYAPRRRTPIYFLRVSVDVHGIPTPQIVAVDPARRDEAPAAE